MVKRWLVSVPALCVSLMASAQCLFDSSSCRPDAFYVNMGGAICEFKGLRIMGLGGWIR